LSSQNSLAGGGRDHRDPGSMIADAADGARESYEKTQQLLAWETGSDSASESHAKLPA